jgi:adenosylcobinamide-GDP ribazoletransferase
LTAQLAAAIGFLTRLPVWQRSVLSAKDIGRSARWFPLVGAILGGIYVAALWLLSRSFPSLVSAVIIVAIDAAVTGGMHFDGLADSADGFGGGRTREDVLRIMRDHAIGAYGAIALVLAIALKIATIAALIDSQRAISCLVLAPVLGRWSAVLLGATQTYARPPEDDGPKSVGSPTRFVGRTEMIVATIIAVSVAAAFYRWRGAAACVLVAAASSWWAWRCRRRIGGVTGDTLGAGIEISECLVLLLFTALR